MLKTLDKPVNYITTEDLRGYLAEHFNDNLCTNI